MIICLDPGHGGSDPGAVAAPGFTEKELAFLMARRMKEVFVEAKHEVNWTRPELMGASIQERVRQAQGADLFVSVHCNAFSDPSVRGAEAWVVTGDTRSEDLARRWLHAIDGLFPQPLRLRGVKGDTTNRHGSLGVLRGTYQRMPAILIEPGFLTNEQDRGYMLRPTLPFAMGIALCRVLGG